MLVVELTEENMATVAARKPYDESLMVAVAAIIEKVRLMGDEAVIELTNRYDGWPVDTPSDLRVTAAELKQGAARVSKEIKTALETAAERVRSFHQHEKPNSWFITEEGVLLGQKVTPLERAGLYVPGGRASYPSTVLMNAIPAQVAGVNDIAICTPAGPDGAVCDCVLAAAGVVGVTEIYKVGGAQAVAAMAFGTDTIAPVDKITGPGNVYVTLAKKLVVGQVGIDMLAGPSEVVIVADDSADRDLIAWDMLAQAEHDPMASAILVTTSERLAGEVQNRIGALLPTLERREVAEQALAASGKIILCDSIDMAFEFVNNFAPEHLEVALADPIRYLGRIRNAGAIFLGAATPEALGDYIAGANHTLPTGGTARFSSPLGVEDFIKRSSVLAFEPAAAAQLAGEAKALADAEGLAAHSGSLAARQGTEDA